MRRNMNRQRMRINAFSFWRRDCQSFEENESRNTYNTRRFAYGMGNHTVGIYDLHLCSGCRTPRQKLCSQCRRPACSTAGLGARQRRAIRQRTPKDDFEVFEDGVEQEISFFTHDDVPISVGLVIDNSASMHNKRERVNSAALSFVRESNPQDETFIVDFDDEAYLDHDFTNSINDLVAALGPIDTRGETALYDAVYLSAAHLDEGNKDKKALLVITDGEDNASKYSREKVLSKLRESKVTVYAIGLLDENDSREPFFGKSQSPTRKAKEVLQQFVQATGGRAYFPRSVEEIGPLCRSIARDLRNQYTIGYTPSNEKVDGTWRRTTVRLNPSKVFSRVTVSAKEGYYAPRTQDSVQH